MIKEMHRLLSDNDRKFLLSLKNGNPQWELFAFPKAAELPAEK